MNRASDLVIIAVQLGIIIVSQTAVMYFFLRMCHLDFLVSVLLSTALMLCGVVPLQRVRMRREKL